MKNVSAPKNSKGASAPSGNKSMGGSSAKGPPHMPRVGGHTSNITPSQGVGPGNGKGC